MSLWSLFAQVTGLAKLGQNSPLVNWEGYGGWARDSTRPVDIVTGCFFLTTRELWGKLGGFDENFFMYAEEADLCYRSRQFGAEPKFTPMAMIIHYGGASETARSSKLQRLFTSKVKYLKKHESGWRLHVGIRLLELLAATRALGFSALAIVGRRERHRVAAREWGIVFASRRVWRNGEYPIPVETSALARRPA
jgi:GT2 family glycosyltransferase